ncbi:MAG: hypothetical protein GF408_06060, partial [Candidatus Omnitrophica bacterium]|nr:hypothetical protein [Candidatus Omnitrophota bacterium]
MEYTIIIMIVILVMLVVAYAVGVEKGKRTAVLIAGRPPAGEQAPETAEAPPIGEETEPVSVNDIFWDDTVPAEKAPSTPEPTVE